MVDFERLPKRVLFERLQQQFSEERMHRGEGGNVKRCREDEGTDAQSSDAAACKKSRRGKKQKRAKNEDEPINDRDPIMFTELGEHKVNCVVVLFACSSARRSREIRELFRRSSCSFAQTEPRSSTTSNRSSITF